MADKPGAQPDDQDSRRGPPCKTPASGVFGTLKPPVRKPVPVPSPQPSHSLP